MFKKLFVVLELKQICVKIFPIEFYVDNLLTICLAKQMLKKCGRFCDSVEKKKIIKIEQKWVPGLDLLHESLFSL